MNTLQKVDSVINAHPYASPNAATSQSNNIGSSDHNHSNLEDNLNNSTIPLAPPTPINTSHHKNSFKGAKLARRARSFKDDLFEKISLMRTPTNTLGRSNSPNSPRSKNASTKPPPTAEEVARSSQSLDIHVKDICNALKHFRDVILKKKLEVLPGNGTVILETIASMFAVIQSYTLSENSTILVSATQQVYQSLGKLIKLCDEVMLIDEDDEECATLSNENVREVVDMLEDAVKNLVVLAQQKLKEKEENAFKYNPSVCDSHNHLMRPPIEVAGQRTSLPDITLTPKERDSLEKTQSAPIRASHSTESVLRGSSPPQKPPLPNRSSNPPPLPPKRRSQQNSNNISSNSDLDCSSDFSLPNYGVDHLSVRSRSPDENSSQCSLDSALNNSREEEDLKVSGLENRCENVSEDDTERIFHSNKKSNENGKQDKKNSGHSNISTLSKSSLAAGIQCLAAATIIANSSNNKVNESLIHNIDTVDSMDKTELRHNPQSNNRHSNESGFVSFKSYRTSTQSVSKRSSEYSFQSSTKSSCSEIGFSNNEFNITSTKSNCSSSASSATTTSSSSSSSTTTTEQQLTTKVYSSISNPLSIDEGNHVNIVPQIASPNSFTSDNQIRSLSSFIKANSLEISSNEDNSSIDNNVPPALPPKISKTKERTINRYENFDAIDDSLNDVPELRIHPLQQQSMNWHTKHQSLIEPRRPDGLSSSRTTIACETNFNEPPPLPMKKKYILAYMEICSASTRSVETHRHTMHALNMSRNISHSQTMNVVTLPGEPSPDNEIPPALPPKTNKSRKAISTPPTIITTPPASPKPTNGSESLNGEGIRYNRVLGSTQGGEMMSTLCEETTSFAEEDPTSFHSHNLPNECKKTETEFSSPTPYDSEDLNLNRENSNLESATAIEKLPNLLEELDITPYLVIKKDNEDCSEVKGGYIEALIVHASRNPKVSDNAFSEAFITTFRTFIQPIEVIEKLIHRYTVLLCQPNDQKQRAAKETFSLLVRVVNDLTFTDLTNKLLSLVVDFIFQLVCSGQLYMAKLLRNKFVEKVTLYKEQKLPPYQMDMYTVTCNQPSLLDLKSVEIAEQMTLLDADLFQKIEIPEVLLFAKEQCEEKSPNLYKFSEHFNKMSFWARSKILMLTDAKEREKHVVKFIKIMKHLRKMNNYNSYLALLCAVDSAVIRRLDWHKTITESLKEYNTLIDSSSSFRVYRQALAETNPPCIPYIGLVLSDLLFVHVGNPDYLTEGVINFSKRWQQYNIIVNLKRFKKCSYPFKRNDRIIKFFENFENYLGEEEMWKISESIKPRGKRNVQY